MDKRQSKEYRDFLLQFSNLKDTGWRHNGVPKPNYSNFMRETIRNCKDYTSPHVLYTDDDGRERRTYRPSVQSLKSIQAHCDNGKDDTIYMINSLGFDNLMVMIDFDMDGELPDEIRHNPEHRRLSGLENQGLAESVSREFFGNQTYIEPSTNGAGRHMYLFFDLIGADKAEFKTFLWEFVTKYLRQKYKGKYTYSKVDRPMGLPTFWTIVNGQHKILTRGNLMKMPYLSGDGGLDRLKVLANSPIKFTAWSRAISDYRANQDSHRNSLEAISRVPEPKLEVLPVPLAPEGLKQENSTCMSLEQPLPADGIVQSDTLSFSCASLRKMLSMDTAVSIDPVRGDETFSGLDGKGRKDKLIPLLLRQSNGKISLDQIMDIYHSAGLATGMEEKDIQIRRAKMSERHAFWLKNYAAGNQRQAEAGNTIPNYIGVTMPKIKEICIFEKLDLSQKNVQKWENKIKEIIPESELKWSRREKICYTHLSVFFICKITASFDPKENVDMYGCSSRNVFLKGLNRLTIDRIIDVGFNSHTHKFIFDLLEKYELIEVREKHVVSWKINGQIVKQGRARRVCIGRAVDPILREIWINRYETMTENNEINEIA